MINLLAISYNNIGPFKERPLSINFQTGKYLIKAPIGSGKSFLFFDGPIYGLYKYSTRSLLNIQSKEGTIKLLFEINGETYFLIRNLSRAKVKESCSSKLYKLNTPSLLKRGQGGDFKEEEVLMKHDILENITNLEEISFKNETDLQQTIEAILPPREVFVNTVFLMQDSDNIFELQPAERLNVLKNVFNLLGIDEAKDKINEKKREMSYKLKALQDTSKTTEKTQFLIASYLSSRTKIQESEFYVQLRPYQEKKDEIDALQEKITINDLDISHFPSDFIWEINTIIQERKNKEGELIGTSKQLEERQTALQREQKSIEENTHIYEKENTSLTILIKNINPEILEQAKKKKQEYIQQIEEGEKSLSKEDIQSYIKKTDLNITEERSTKEISTIREASLFTQFLINKGKQLQQDISISESQIKNEELLLKNQEEKKTNLDQQLKTIQETIQKFTATTEQQAIFHCEKIETNCPFIKVINKQTFDTLEAQKQQFLDQEISLQKKQNEEESKLQELKKQSNITKLQEYISSTEKTISEIKIFLNQINRKEIENIYQKQIESEKEIKLLDKQIQEGEKELNKKDEYQRTIEKNTTLIESYQEQKTKLQKELSDIQIRKTTIEQERTALWINRLLPIETELTRIQQTLNTLDQLIADHKKTQREIQEFKEQETILSNLSLIFSKELLLLVLQDNLPILNDIINNYLSQVVDFQLSLVLDKSNTDKLELLATVIDEKGQRDIKSLSGGQRVLLKIVRMLAISSYMHSPILFLDETINNLDGDTVSKVADMLSNFVKQRTMKLYTVTHNQHIQDMNIRDQVIEIA